MYIIKDKFDLKDFKKIKENINNIEILSLLNNHVLRFNKRHQYPGYDVIINDDDDVKKEFNTPELKEIYVEHYSPLTHQRYRTKFEKEILLFGNTDDIDKCIVSCLSISEIRQCEINLIMSFKKYQELRGTFTYYGLSANAEYFKKYGFTYDFK